MKVCLLVIFQLILTVAYTQKQSKLEIGPAYKVPKNASFLAAVQNQPDESLLNLYEKKESLLIQKFDGKSLRQISLQEAGPAVPVKDMAHEACIQFQNQKCYWLYSGWDNKNDKEQLYAGELQLTDGAGTKTQQLISQSEKLAGSLMQTGTFKVGVLGKYSFIQSSNKALLLVQYTLQHNLRNDKKNKDVVGLHVYDGHMQKQWGGEFELPYTESECSIRNYFVDTEGNAYIAARVTQPQQLTGSLKYAYQIFKYPAASPKPVIYKVNVGDYYIKQLIIKDIPQGQPMLVCSYSMYPGFEGTKGIYVGLLQPDGQVTDYKKGQYPIDKEVWKKYEMPSVRAKMEANPNLEIAQLKINNIIIEPEGGLFIGGQAEFSSEKTRGSGTSYYTTTQYFAEPVMAMHINALGERDWFVKIPKFQRSLYSFSFIGAAFHYHNGQYVYYYSDNGANARLDEDNEPKVTDNGKDALLFETIITADGRAVKYKLGQELNILPGSFVQLGNGRLWARADAGRYGYLPLLISF